MKPKKKVFVGLVLVIVGLVSYEKIFFALRLAAASAAPVSSQNRLDQLFAEYIFKNKALEGMTDLPERESFLVPYAEQLIKRSLPGRGPGAGRFPFLPALARKFPDNFLLDAVGLYDQAPGNRDWENLDALSFRVLSDPGFNSISYAAAVKHAPECQFSEGFFENLLYFLNWQRNFDLSDRLLVWAFQQRVIDLSSAETLSRDLAIRKGGSDQDRETSRRGVDQMQAILGGHMADQDVEIILGENLIQDDGYKEKASWDELWNFSDMSDYGPFAKGSFFGAVDGPVDRSLRAMCFFIKSIPGKEDSRAGFWYKHPIRLESESYVWHFRYRTRGTTEKPSFYLQYAFDREWPLEPAAASWRDVFFVFDNSVVRKEKINFLLRMWGPGSVWFDDIGFYALGERVPLSEKFLLFIGEATTAKSSSASRGIS